MSTFQKYLIAAIVLLMANLLLFFTSPSTRTSSFDDRTFVVENTDDVVAVSIFLGEEAVEIAQSGSEWQLNGTYKVDENFRGTLFSIFERIKVNRVLTDKNLQPQGSVEINFKDGSKQVFGFVANATKTKSYFLQEGKVFEVSVPGYRDNVVDVFTLHPDQWRDRLMVDGSWRTIQKLSVKQTGKQPFEIEFADQFFLLNGEAPSDSSAVVEYLNQYQYLQANEMLSEGRIPSLDSLAKTEAMATLTIDDIKAEVPKVFSIYPRLEGQRFHLVVAEGGYMMVVDATRVQRMLSL